MGDFDAKALHTYEGGQQVDFGGVRGMAIGRREPPWRRRLHKATNPLGAVNEPMVLVFDAKSRKLTQTPANRRHHRGVIWGLRYLADGSLMGACGG